VSSASSFAFKHDPRRQRPARGKRPSVSWAANDRPRVLLALDRQVLVECVGRALEHDVYVTRIAATAAEVNTAVAEWLPHLAILDVDLVGPQVIARLSPTLSSGGRLPLIGLTRRSDLKSRLGAFEAGLDDILTIPFAPEELAARVIAVLRRSRSAAVTFTPLIKIGELEIDILRRTARTGDSELYLTSLEQSLLYLLAANAGRVVTRDEILDALWGVDYVAESNVVDRQIRNLRARLQDDWRQPRFIATVPGRGYRFLYTSVARG
jgi:DNA-binding response OmpR family regulator